MDSQGIHPYLTQPDVVVLTNLFHDIQEQTDRQTKTLSFGTRIEGKSQPAKDHLVDHSTDKAAIDRLIALNDKNSPHFLPTVFTTWDGKDIHPLLNHYIVEPYNRWAQNIVRHSTDVVFLTHIITYVLVSVPSAAILFYRFTWIHGGLHSIWSLWCAGSFTLMMHNHVHNNGILSPSWAWLDLSFPYILEPLMGHTWDSYYYHHVKHHHVEGNGMILS